MRSLGATTLLLLSTLDAHALMPTAVAVSYDAVYQRVSPDHVRGRSPGTVSFRVVGDHLQSFGVGESAEYGLGQRALFHLRNGVNYSAEWTKRGDELFDSLSFPGYSAVVRVRLLRSGSCLASVSFRRNPGERYFFYDAPATGVRYYESSMVAENVTCRSSY